MSHITTINNGKLRGRVIKISFSRLMPSAPSIADKQSSTYNTPANFIFPKLIMSEDLGPVLQQLGQLQGQMQSMVSAQHQQLKQAADLNVTMRIEIEKVNNSITNHKDILEKRQDKLELKLESLKVKVSFIAAAVALGANIAIQIVFKLWQ